MFPSGFYRDENGELNVQGIKIDALTTKYGTPLFIYDTGLMKERYELFLNTVKCVKGNIHFAVKANDSVNIIKFYSLTLNLKKNFMISMKLPQNSR